MGKMSGQMTSKSGNSGSNFTLSYSDLVGKFMEWVGKVVQSTATHGNQNHPLCLSGTIIKY